MPAPPDPPAPDPPRVGRYELVRKLGEGGMGTVYLARDTLLDRPVALKIPRFGAGAGREVLDRFLREARAAAAVRHPNLCPVHDVGEAGGTYYLTMAYIEGRTLADRLAELPDGAGVPAAEAAAVVRGVAEGMAEAHQAGILHRDLKPANVMLDRRGRPVVMDFGLARRGDADANLSQPGSVLGTPAYMAPEQAAGDAAAVGPRTDVYALGVVLYEMLAGDVPFRGPVAAVIGQVLYSDPPPPSAVLPGVDPGLEAVCRRAMAKNPADRFAGMDEFAAALAGWEAAHLTGSVAPGGSAAPPSHPTLSAGPSGPWVEPDPRPGFAFDPAPPRPPAPPRRSVVPWLAAAGGVVVVGVAALTALLLTRGPKPEPTAATDPPPPTTRPKTPPTTPASPTAKKPPAPAPLPTGRWTPVLNTPADFDGMPHARFNNGLLELTAGGVNVPGVRAADVSVRAKVKKAFAAFQNVSLYLRMQERNGENDHYWAWFNGGNWFGISRRTNRKIVDLRQFKSRASHNDFFEMTFTAVGDRLTLLADGELVGEVRDASVPGPGTVRVHSHNGRAQFRDIEVQVLDPKAAGPAGPAGEWRRVLNALADLDGVPGAKLEGGILALNNTRVPVPGLWAKDVAVRARVRKSYHLIQNLSLNLRQSDDAARDGYTAWFQGGNVFGLGRRTNNAYTDLGQFRTRQSFPDFFEMTFTAVGDRLTVHADGELVCEVRDSTVAGAGRVILNAHRGPGEFRDVEVRVLDP